MKNQVKNKQNHRIFESELDILEDILREEVKHNEEIITELQKIKS